VSLIHHLCSSLMMEKSQLLSFVFSAPKRYKKYSIPKRNGKGSRLIAHPSKSLKHLQRASLPFIRGMLKVHESALAYEKETGIKKNAALHVNNTYLLKMDFTNFFPSITPQVLFDAFHKAGFNLSEEDKFIYSCLFFWAPTRKSGLELSIGAPSSPFISNAIMYWFDESISNYCKKMKISYTRYADDLTFSTNIKNSLFNIPDFINAQLMMLGMTCLSINNEKTVFLSKACNRHVTGVTLSNDNQISLGRNRKRNLSSAIHYFKQNKLNVEEIKHLQGMLGFAKHIEPEFIIKVANKYGEEVIEQIQKYNKS